MEKQNAYNPGYPQMPRQMHEGGASSSGLHQAPPSYDQATSAAYTGNVQGPPLQQPNYAAYNNQAGFVPPPHSYASQHTVPVVQQPVVIIQQQAFGLPLGPEPTFVTCPACQVQKLTRIEYEPNSRTHLMAAILCLLGLWCCVCLPYCASGCMSTNHYCGNCNKFLGTYGGSL